MSNPAPPNRLLGAQFQAPPRAGYATNPLESRGRLWPEAESPTRTCYQRDRDRIIHSTAFRRLKHKTQVFVQHEGDFYRTRLTHSLEVSQIARSLSRLLGLDEDLAEALALSHDLGHPPFGHAGEAALDACMVGFGGFDHNAQALALVTRIEHRYAEFDGLNLTWETLEGLVKHNGPLLAETLPEAIAAFAWDLELSTYAGAEAQIAALADDIAYINHDIDDGLRAGLFEIGEVFDAPLAGPIFLAVNETYPGLERGRLVGEAIRRLITGMVSDVALTTSTNLSSLAPGSAADIRRARAPVVTFSADMGDQAAALKAFLFRAMYRHPRVVGVMNGAQTGLARLFGAFLADPGLLPKDWAEECRGEGDKKTARAVCDYVAGMTDRFAIQEYNRIFREEFPMPSSSPETSGASPVRR